MGYDKDDKLEDILDNFEEREIKSESLLLSESSQQSKNSNYLINDQIFFPDIKVYNFNLSNISLWIFIRIYTLHITFQNLHFCCRKNIRFK